MQTVEVLDHGGFNLIKTVCAKHLANDGECAFTPLLFGGQKITHTAGRIHITCHVSNLLVYEGRGFDTLNPRKRGFDTLNPRGASSTREFSVANVVL